MTTMDTSDQPQTLVPLSADYYVCTRHLAPFVPRPGEIITVTAAPPGALCTRCKQPAHGGFRQMLAVKTRSIGDAATVAR